MNRNILYGIGVAIVILALIIFFSLRSCNTSIKTKNTEVTTTLDPCADRLKDAYLEIDNLRVQNQALQAELDECCPKKKELTIEERLERLERTRLSTAPPSKRKAPQNQTTPRDVGEKDFSGGGFTASTPPSSNFERQSNTGSQVNSGVKMDFSGDIPAGSKFGTTVTADRFRLYYVKDNYVRENGMSIPAPRLNGTDGSEFNYDSSSGYWFYIDTNTLLSPSMINNSSYAVIWCIYIGPIGTWDAFLPHESLKAEMKRVRGREDGAITMDELYKMHQTNSDIWTDQNKNGSLMPKSFNPITGETDKGTKIGPQDGLIYQGWDFRTITVGTVSTEKVNGNSFKTNSGN